MHKYFVPSKIYLLLLDNGFSETLIYCESENTIVATPLYHQVFDWLEQKGLYIRDLHVPDINQWGACVYSIKDGRQLFPGSFSIHVDFKLSPEKEQAWNAAIIVALEILKKYEINTGSGKEAQSGTKDSAQL